jgi:hypothetical protein
MDYKQKYLKYKNKYLELKGGLHEEDLRNAQADIRAAERDVNDARREQREQREQNIGVAQPVVAGPGNAVPQPVGIQNVTRGDVRGNINLQNPLDFPALPGAVAVPVAAPVAVPIAHGQLITDANILDLLRLRYPIEPLSNIENQLSTELTRLDNELGNFNQRLLGFNGRIDSLEQDIREIDTIITNNNVITMSNYIKGHELKRKGTQTDLEVLQSFRQAKNLKLNTEQLRRAVMQKQERDISEQRRRIILQLHDVRLEIDRTAELSTNEAIILASVATDEETKEKKYNIKLKKIQNLDRRLLTASMLERFQIEDEITKIQEWLDDSKNIPRSRMEEKGWTVLPLRR